MATASIIHVVDDAGLEQLRSPRDDHLVLERPLDDDRWEADDGPYEHYRRDLAVTPADGGGHRVEETVHFSLAAPFWKIVLTPLARRALRRPPRPGRIPWWAPPDRFDARSSRVIAVLASLSVVAGYLGTIISQTITFAAAEFDASKSAQGVTLAAVRVGVVIAVVMTMLADRKGRQPVLKAAAVAGCVIAATGALAPGLWGLGVSQAVARGLSTTLALLIGIMAVEETPAASRAYVVSVLSMAAALGSGMVVWVLPVADLGEAAWRLVYLVPLLAVPAVLMLTRRLPESKRFEANRVQPPRRPGSTARTRLKLLAVTFFLLALFAAPASQFQNEFLRDERGFSAARITLFQLSVNTPAGIGVLVAGRLADLRGRRIVAAVGLIGGATFTILRYSQGGWPMWAWGVIGTIVGAATIPSLGVYAPELFSTSRRGTNNGAITVVGVAGSALGLLLAGFLFDRLAFGTTFLLLGMGPLLVAALVLARYPETARRELEDINPGDAAPDADDPPAFR